MDTNLIMAKFAIAKAKKPSTTEKVLAEIISLYPSNIIEYPPELSPTISQNLSITPDVFRINMSKLYKMKLIMKHGNQIIINPIIRKSFTNGNK